MMATEQERIKFDNPPINELVVSLFHMPIPELKAQHIGIYWNRIHEKYPHCDQHPVVVSLSDQQTVMEPSPGEIFPLPRFWFYGDNHPTLVQVQRNAFMVNWRRLPGAPAGDYPHYEMVIRDFWQELENYKLFVQTVVGGKLDIIQRCELNYVNIISTNELFDGPSQIVNVLPPLASLRDLHTDERQLAGINAIITHRINSNLLIDLTIRLGRRVDTDEPVLGLELKAHGVPSDLSLDHARAWYDSAHDATYKLFLDATAEQIQKKLWKPR
jgi:uncharacterized protein (TIGR04255 family)